MDYPQITLIVLWAIGFGVVASKNGQPRGVYSIWGQLIGLAVNVAILYWGGFWG